MEETRQEDAQQSTQTRAAAGELDARLRDTDREMKNLKQRMSALTAESTLLDEERLDLAKSKGRLELQVRDIAEAESLEHGSKESLEESLGSVNREIENKTQELRTLEVRYENVKKEHAAVKEKLDKLDSQRTMLYQRQGRSSQFTNQTQRDQWIRKEIKQIKESLKAQRNQEQDLSADIDELKSKLTTLAGMIEERRIEVDDRRKSLEETRLLQQQHKTTRDQLTNERKWVLFRTEYILLIA